jgi:hypothetical protein
MTFSTIQQINNCESIEELESLWKFNIQQWSTGLTRAEARSLILAKDLRKNELNEKTEGYPIPTDEKTFSMDERLSLMVDGAESYPVSVTMESAPLGVVGVLLWPDRAIVDGCEYSNAEMTDLKSRGLSHEKLLNIHEVKRGFEGQVITQAQATEIEKSLYRPSV